MKFLPFIFFTILCPFFLSAQNYNSGIAIEKLAVIEIPDSVTTTTEGIALFINSNYFTENDKVSAIYTWITTNIRYDVDNMFAINFYVKKEEIINKALKTRKGICSNYAALFNDLCSKTGVKSYQIEGYTKQRNFVDYLPHAWCAAFVDSIWYMYDPTWGAGYVNQGKFYAEVNYKYYKAAPSELIKSHMPFDCLWQFLYYPVSPQQFYDDSTQDNINGSYFSYPDSIKRYEMLPVSEQLIESYRRIERAGVKNSLIYDRLQHLKNQIETLKQNTNINLYNSAGADFNEGINFYNTFIDYRNKMFTPMRSDAELKRMIDLAASKLHEARIKISKIKDPDDNVANLIASINKLINRAVIQVNEQEEFVRQYLSKPPAERKKMFYK